MVDVTAPGRRTFLSQLFTFRGRSGRANFWLSLLAIVCAYLIIVNVILVIFSQSDAFLDVHPVGVGLGFLNFIIFMAFYSLAAIRRLHDRDKSGHWLWLFFFVPAALNVGGLLHDHQVINLAPRSGLIIPAIALFAWAIIEFGFLRGTSGANRFGPDPTA
jgi:uncharacterized membrane protein YhaH (DUF805 family)